MTGQFITGQVRAGQDKRSLVLVLDVLKAFINGLFIGMSQSQTERGNFAGALAHAESALRSANVPWTRFAAHAQMAKVLQLGGREDEMRNHKARALQILAHHPSITEDEAMSELHQELIALP
jgi:hypothetical protein